MELENTNKNKHRETFVSATTMDTDKTMKSQSSSFNKANGRRSKISCKMNIIESSCIRCNAYSDLIKEEEYEADQNFTRYAQEKIGSLTMISNSIRTKINFLFVIEKKDALFSMNLFLPGDTTISELIRYSIMKFNDDEFMISSDNMKQYRLSLKESYKDYEVKPSKKNNYPKMDLPSFCDSALIYDTQISNFSLIIKKENVIATPSHHRGCFACKPWKFSCSVL